MKTTFVIPVYNERDTLEALVEGIAEQTEPSQTDILFIDDGSTDGSFEVMRGLSERFENVQAIRFRRNLGKSAALAVGFARAEGDIVFTMDADLQDDPKEIPRFIEKLEAGYDLVSGWKKRRFDPWHKTLPSRLYNAVAARLFDLPIHDINCGFKAYRSAVVKNLRVYGERHRLIPALAAELGYRIAEIPVEHHPRRYGRSKYGFERFSRGAMDTISVWFMSHYRYRPGHFFVRVALGLMLLGGVVLGCAAALWFVLDAVAIGLAGILAYLILGTGALLMSALGLVAELKVDQHPPDDFDRYIE